MTRKTLAQSWSRTEMALVYVNRKCPVPECGAECQQFMCPTCWPLVHGAERRGIFNELKAMADRRQKAPSPLLRELFRRALKTVRLARQAAGLGV